MNQELANRVDTVFNAIKDRKVDQIYMVACGGSKAFFEPSQYLLDLETEIPATVYTANEFVHRCPKALGKNSLVLSCSLSGNTPETAKAAELAKNKGAISVAFTKEQDSPLWKAAEYRIQYADYPEGAERTFDRSNNALIFTLLFKLLHVWNPNEKYERALGVIDKMEPILAKNREKFAACGDAFGKKYKRASIIYTMGSGNMYGDAYSFTSCLLMEMLWIHSNAIHSGEFFHGPFEVTDYDVPFLLLKSNCETRPLDERAENFLKKFSDEVTVVDAATFDMEGICEDLQGYFAPFVMGAVLRSYAQGLSDHKGHPLSVRRYMWKMDY